MSFQQPPDFRSTLVCGAIASLIGQGCRPDLTQAQGEKLAYAKELVRQGDEFIYPVLEEMAMVANEDLVFGVNGRGGVGTFSEGLSAASKNLKKVILEEEQVYLFNDPHYSSDSFYRSRGKDLIAINEARLSLLVDKNDGKRKVTYGIELHESSHKEEETHSATTNAFVAQENFSTMPVDDILQKLIVEERDFPYLLSTTAEALEYFLSSDVKKFVERQYATLEEEVENANAMGESGRENFEEELVKMETAEGWASLVIDEFTFPFFYNYWGIPTEELQRVIAESGWYEEFVEKDVKEYTAEARKELGMPYEETRGEINMETLLKPTSEAPPPHPEGYGSRRFRI